MLDTIAALFTAPGVVLQENSNHPPYLGME